MITEKEIQATKLSATKKDFYSIWEELIDTANKLSERWSPSVCNESDPGIVLLKVLAGMGDKLNYNIDKNTLEAFLPSAAQESSMRKLCSMLGYSMKYYQSATTTATISYVGDEENIPSIGIIIPAFTSIKDEDDTINYITLEQIVLSESITSKEVPVIEGSIQICETDTDNIISIDMIDDNYRYYLPEMSIAENGIFVYNIDDDVQTQWTKVSNLNTVASGSKVYKFGYDSKQGVPYVQFPEDISSIIADGIYIYYIRTNGVNGNISMRTLTTLTAPDLWSDSDYSEYYENISVEDFSVINTNASTNGADKESLDDAYKNFKKTIGTFDTLVTCRDYMNKIYSLTESENNTTPLVSNVIVSDIRDDINNAITLCTFNDYGISYVDKPITVEKQITGKDSSGVERTITVTENKIGHFNLLLYPFKTVKGYGTKSEYDNSFKYTAENINEIEAGIEENKTIAHLITSPEDTDVACIKNYLKLNAVITTTYKVTSAEAQIIINTIKLALFKDFNLRKIDFGEEIPYDSILECIENADERIKNVSLYEPILYTKFLLANGTEYGLASDGIYEPGILEKTEAEKIYNRLALRNILAGKIALFNYDSDFSYSYDETKYPEVIPERSSTATEYEPVYPEPEDTRSIKEITSDLIIQTKDDGTVIGSDTDGKKLTTNEIVQFRMPNLETTVTYGSYINYFLKLNSADHDYTTPIGATFINLHDWFLDDTTYTTANNTTTIGDALWSNFTAYINDKNIVGEKFTGPEKVNWDNWAHGFFTGSAGNYVRITEWPSVKPTEVYYFPPKDYFVNYKNWLQTNATTLMPGQAQKYVLELYRQLATDTSREVGKYVDTDYHKYMLLTGPWNQSNATKLYANYWIPRTNEEVSETEEVVGTPDGLGLNGVYTHLDKEVDYMLKNGEYLLVNYSQVETDDDGNETGTSYISKYYGEGAILKPATDMYDSETYHSLNHKYNKTEDYNFSGLVSAVGNSSTDVFSGNPDGLFTMGSSEQIEIREPVIIDLWNESDQKTTDDTVYLYFVLNNEEQWRDEETNKYVVFPFGKDPTEQQEDSSQESTTGDTYTLQEGEYLFYTDKNKSDIAYYGNGSTIKRTNSAYTLKKRYEEDQVSVDELTTEGIAALPWISAQFNKNSYIQIIENQYVSLIADDKLIKLTGVTQSVNEDSIQNNEDATAQIDSNKWYTFKKAEYLFSGDETSKTLTGETNIKWEGDPLRWRVKTKLEINAGPATAQTLNQGDVLTLNYGDNEETVLTPGNTTDESEVFTPLTVKSNYYIMSGNSRIDTTRNLYDAYGNLCGTEDDDKITDFQIKVYKQEDVVETATDTLINLNNFSTGNWTKIDLTPSVAEEADSYTTLYINIPNQTSTESSISRYGIIMMQYVTDLTDDEISGEQHKGAYLTIDPTTTTTTTPTLKIFNYKKGAKFDEWDWWDNLKVSTDTSTKYYLRKGINVIKIDKSCNLNIFARSITQGSTITDEDIDALIFGNLSIVVRNKTTNDDDDYGIDLETLSYFDTRTTTTYPVAYHLLQDIWNYDTNNDFYYNGPIDNSEALNINTSSGQTLATPSIWYDYNNANNKFVVSEIDSEYLSDGLTIAKSSRLY